MNTVAIRFVKYGVWLQESHLVLHIVISNKILQQKSHIKNTLNYLKIICFFTKN